ncbi:hypothetical protein KFU94_69230 [Chloroflexi bacterium TSY]|nr:hypothetical protein [Chloroflexi bacterium TSY]
MHNIEAEHYKDALLAGFISEAIDDAVRNRRQLDWRIYEVRRNPPPNYFTLTSQRNGCMSAIEPVVFESTGLVLNREMERAPAIHGSVVLPLPHVNTLEDDTFDLTADGLLSIELNNNNNIVDLAPLTTVDVPFEAGTYTARDVARRIHEELFSRGAGQAAAYPDGKVVVETSVPGLTGSVTIPRPGTGASGGDQALLQALLGTTDEEIVTGRGWPGIGFGDPGDILSPGYRSKNVSSAQATVDWIFSDGTVTATVRVDQGDPIQDIQQAVDSALAAPAGGRIGVCLLGPDNTLYIEGVLIPDPANRNLFIPNNLTLQVNDINGRTLAVIDPGQNQPGRTPEREEEPAVGLRRTHEIRTFRLARDIVGDGDGAEMDDVEWIRTPAHANSLPTAFDHLKGSPAWNLSLPGGRYLMAVRADAAKTREYDQSGEMIASANTDSRDSQRHFVHRARYWMRFHGAETLGIGKIERTVNGNTVTDYLLDILWPG